MSEQRTFVSSDRRAGRYRRRLSLFGRGDLAQGGLGRA